MRLIAVDGSVIDYVGRLWLIKVDCGIDCGELRCIAVDFGRLRSIAVDCGFRILLEMNRIECDRTRLFTVGYGRKKRIRIELN